MKQSIYNIIRVTFGIVFGLIILLIFFGQTREYMCKIHFQLNNFSLLAILAAVFVFGSLINYLCNQRKITLCSDKINYDRWVMVLTLVLFVMQCYVFYNIFFLSGWDVKVVRKAATYLAEGNLDKFRQYSRYYSWYPNNLFITYMNALILKINNNLGVFSGKYIMMSGVIICSMINSLSCYLVYKVLDLIAEKKVALAGFILAVLSFGISSWTVIFYSDSVGLIFPVLCIYLYMKPVSKVPVRYIYRFLAVFTAIVGYYIKPQCVIMLIAIMVVEIIKLFCGFNTKQLIKPMGILISAVFCILVISQSINILNTKTGIDINKEKKFGMTHFFMMGLNEEFNGVYYREDVDYSGSFDTADERKAANIEVAVKRLKNMGPDGYINLISKKMLTAYNDGTFAWGIEGEFYYKMPKDLNKRMSPYLKSVYYNNGSRNGKLMIFQQSIWLAILLGSFASCFVKSDEYSKKQMVTLWVSVLGLTLFECLFEVRARYLYTFVPIYCVLGALGLKIMCNSFCKLFHNVLSKCNLNRKKAC